MSDPPITIPPALVQGCNTPHGINVLSDWIEEQTGNTPDFHQSSWSETGFDGYKGFLTNTYDSTGDGHGYGMELGNGNGDGYEYGMESGNGNGYGYEYSDGSGNGIGNGFPYYGSLNDGGFGGGM